MLSPVLWQGYMLRTGTVRGPGGEKLLGEMVVVML